MKSKRNTRKRSSDWLKRCDLKALKQKGRLMSKSISNRMPPVVVEYDCRGERKSKRFSDPYEARRFYAAKFKANKNPMVKKERRDQAIS